MVLNQSRRTQRTRDDACTCSCRFTPFPGLCAAAYLHMQLRICTCSCEPKRFLKSFCKQLAHDLRHALLLALSPKHLFAMTCVCASAFLSPLSVSSPSFSPCISAKPSTSFFNTCSSAPSQMHVQPVCATPALHTPAANPSPERTSTAETLTSFLSRAREGNPLRALHAAERSFSAWKTGRRKIPSMVETTLQTARVSPDVDVVVAGGTLGIFLATALQARGVNVAVVERGPLKGRNQEWNISREELQALVKENVLTNRQVDSVIVNEFPAPSRIGLAANPKRKGVRNGADSAPREVFVQGVLNVGVDPSMLIALVKERFVQLGGRVLEYHALQHVRVWNDVVQLSLQPQRLEKGAGALGAGGSGLIGQPENAPSQVLHTRLLVDAMGSFSPIAAQARGERGLKPDGVCITVGSCLHGDFGLNDSSDLLYSFQPIYEDPPVQYFWEAFPAGTDRKYRTTYLFSYGPCDESRQSLTATLEDYLRYLPQYQNIILEQVDVQRVLFGFFPCFRESPLDVTFDRILPFGDAGGLQSPISFGGFACCLRHLSRVSNGIEEALSVRDDSLLTREELRLMQFYNPALSVTWLFNKAMSVSQRRLSGARRIDKYIINDLMWQNMSSMAELGPSVQKPFLQDVVTAHGLLQILLKMTSSNIGLALKTFAFVGPAEILTWLRHFSALILFAGVAPVASAMQHFLRNGQHLNAKQKYRINRLVDGLRYGAGLDHNGNT